jgi:lipopolysaccharide transport system ATP-binding protein
MSDLARSGRTIIFVSHNLDAVRKLCSRTVYLKNGHVAHSSEDINGLTSYINDINPNTIEFIGTLSKYFKLEGINVNNEKNKVVSIEPADDIIIKIIGNAKKNLPKIRLTISVYKDDIRVFSLQDCMKPTDLKRGRFSSIITVPGGLLRPGDYQISFGGYQNNGEDWFYGEHLAFFKVKDNWTTTNEKVNIGIINIRQSGVREEL